MFCGCRIRPMIHRCVCGQYWTGDHCTVDVNECENEKIKSSCEPHGVCVNTPVC